MELGDIPWGPDVLYSQVLDDTALCNYFGNFFDDNSNVSYTPPPVITGLQDLSNGQYLPFQPVVDTPQSANQYLIVYGHDLTAAGLSNPPTICIDTSTCSSGGTITVTGFHLGSGWYATDAQINIPFWVDANATPGTYTISLATVGGQTQSSFSVGDASPVITGLSSNSFVVGVNQTIVVSGAHFGTNCPSITLPFTTSTLATSQCLDNAVTVNLTPNGAGSGSLTLKAQGYGGLPFDPQSGGESQTAQASVSSVLAAIQLTLAGPITISTDGLYSENATIALQAVRSDNCAPVNFPFAVYLIEDNTSIYSQNGGFLPGLYPNPITLSAAGSAQVVARSLAGPSTKTGLVPDAAQLKSANFQTCGGDLAVPQWVISGARIDPRATGGVYDWFQSRSRDLFASAQGTAATVLSAMSAYFLTSAPGGNPAAGGFTPANHTVTSVSQISPFATSMRINGPASAFPTTCGVYRSHEFTDTFYHEARHGYQYSLSVNKTNDVDQDYLVNSIPIAPTTVFLDTNVARAVCNPPTVLPTPISYLGDTIGDAWQLVLYALEQDAYTFVGLNVP